MKSLIVRDSFDEKNIVVQSNALIESCYALSVSEQKIVFTVISMINPDDKNFCSYKFRISEFMKSAGIDDQTSYKRIRDLSKGLMEKVITIHRPKSILYVNWFSSAEYFEGEGYVKIQVSPELKPYLINLKEQFTQYQLKYVMQLKSFYSIRIYGLLKQYEKFKVRTFELKILRQILGILPEVYKLYADFKKKVLLVAQKELAEKADLMFEFEEIKKRKRVEKIKFKIIKKQSQGIKALSYKPDLPGTYKVPAEIDLLIPERYKMEPVYQIIQAYLTLGMPNNVIISNLTYSVTHSKKNFVAYLKKALKDDYAKDKRAEAIKSKNNGIAAAEDAKEKKQEEKAELAAIEKNIIDSTAWWEKLPEDVKKTMKKQYESPALKGLLMIRYAFNEERKKVNVM